MSANGSDVEEVVWRWACDIRETDMKTARKRMMVCGDDPRVPMAEILNLFQDGGEDKVLAVLSQAEKDGSKNAKAYASFYVGFYYDLIGDLATALPHLRAAASAPSEDYMGKVFRLHARLVQDDLASQVAVSSIGLEHKFSFVVLGGWQFSSGHHDNFAEEKALQSMEHHRRFGISSIDMGDIYTGVEALVGKHIARCASTGASPQSVIIHTKLVPDLDNLSKVDSNYVKGVLLRSRNRLGICHPLDLVQFHWWDWNVGCHVSAYRHLCSHRPILVKECGVTNYDAQHLRELLSAGLPVASNQVQYSLIDSRVEAHLVPLCRQHDVKLLPYGVLAGGFLSDRWLHQEEPSSQTLENRSLTKYKLMVDEFGGWGAFQHLLALCREIADSHRGDCGISDVAVAYIAQQDCVGGIILGARSKAHIGSTLRAANLKLTSQEIGRISQFLCRTRQGPAGDFYELERERKGRHGQIMRYNLNRVHSDVHLAEVQARIALWEEENTTCDSAARTFLQQLGEELQSFHHGSEYGKLSQQSGETLRALEKKIVQLLPTSI
eukprot:gene7868-9343_t